MKDWKVSKEVQAKRDRKAAKIRIKEALARGKASKGQVRAIKALTDQDSSHRTPYTYPRFLKRLKSDTAVWDRKDFEKEMKKQKK